MVRRQNGSSNNSCFNHDILGIKREGNSGQTVRPVSEGRRSKVALTRLTARPAFWLNRIPQAVRDQIKVMFVFMPLSSLFNVHILRSSTNTIMDLRKAGSPVRVS